MAGTAGPPPDLVALYRALEAEPWRFGFLSTLRRIDALVPVRPPFGESARLAEDPIRLGQQPTLAFAPSTLARFAPRGEGRAPRLEVYFLGLFGPNGPLPIHLTEYVRDRLRNSDDPTLARFADVFHHRVLSLFYRGWARAQPTVNFDRPDTNRYAVYLGSLFGTGRAVLQHRDAMPDVFKLHFSGRLSCQTRNAEGLEGMLQTFFRVAVRITEFVGEWIPVPEAGVCRLGARPDTCTLGLNVIVGARIWEGQQKFRITFGPLMLADYERLLPGGQSLARLVAIVRNYIGDELNWDVNLILKREEQPALQLGGSTRLGWTTWLGGPPRTTDPADLYLRPLAFTPQPGYGHA
jgi:type VI secretion system protein ImpH